mmetsp:Transcript_18649/g.31342  ORF Transcript_18649/g.31342 Transcript_18649/m.31342 type:complete len:266 (+) Transcript_18649:257-1054(+)|eukprot:CAMPEP_0198200410 /NCGR_PEP_ID=MMETSP1445-20131203/3423_1 /TAXON_ID=36898 /ORGANISM="Pyramimonas sp., Strain CCMP2087" /LENGTH=265 /DNA_ID=CAMNT_0043870467 /DNA_START=239 /DNA_END=1036 /DNA_ORIENTATION=+
MIRHSGRLHIDVDDAATAFERASLGEARPTNPTSSSHSRHVLGGRSRITEAQLSASQLRGRNEAPGRGRRDMGAVSGGSGYNLDNLAELENADTASASALQARPMPYSPPVPGGGRSGYNLEFVDYENESTDGEDGYESDSFEEDWKAFWDGRLSQERIEGLNCHIALKGGTDLEEIKKLPILTYGSIAVGSVNAECSVCLEDFNNADQVNSLPCGHHFHTGCIRSALKVNNKCPYCRFVMPARSRPSQDSRYVQYEDYEDDLFD